MSNVFLCPKKTHIPIILRRSPVKSNGDHMICLHTQEARIDIVENHGFLSHARVHNKGRAA